MEFTFGCEGSFVETFEEGDDFSLELAGGLLLGLAIAEDLHASIDIAKADRFRAGMSEEIDLFGEESKEDEFKTIASFTSGADKRDGHGWGEGDEVIGDGVASDLAQHDTHPFEEILKREDPEGAAFFEVVEDAVANVINEGEIDAVAGDRCAAK
jgi:hypothetical protein